MKILFLQDNGINESLSLADCAGLLRAEGHTCALLLSRNEKNLSAKVAAFNPDLFIIPCDIWGEHVALGLCTAMKQQFGKPVAVCGTYPMLFPEVVEEPGVDIAAMGESEFALLDLARALESGDDITAIPNLHVKRDGEVFRNPMRRLIEDLTVLPLPMREIYYRYAHVKNFTLKRFTSGRGCPNACAFCYNEQFKKMYKNNGCYVRRKPVERIIEEIAWMRGNAPMRSVHFSDDLFTDDRPWIAEFCRRYAADFKLPFTCNTAVSEVDEETIASLARAGCKGIAIGVETGREQIRVRTLKKPFGDDEILRTAALIKKYGMLLTVFTMLGLPGETLDNAFETVQLTRRMKADNPRIVFISPIPRTTMTEKAVRDGLLDADYEFSAGALNQPVFKTKFHREFINLYYLYDLALRSPFMERIVRRLVGLPLPGFLRLLLMPRMLREKKFFSLTFLSGFIFYLHTDIPQNRTKNFNNYLP